MLRKLMNKAADKMLEWMHDQDINCYFRFDANDSKDERHYAIVNEEDEQYGTFSLKTLIIKI